MSNNPNRLSKKKKHGNWINFDHDVIRFLLLKNGGIKPILEY